MPEGQRVGEGSESIEASGSLLCRKISSVVAEASLKNSLLAPPALMLQDSLFVDVCMRDEDIRISRIYNLRPGTHVVESLEDRGICP